MRRILALLLAFVLGCCLVGVGQTLSGTWDVDITIDPQDASFADAIWITSVLTADYTVGDWTFSSITTLEFDTGTYMYQTFNAAGMLGAFTINSNLDFNMSIPRFDEWIVDVAVSLAGIDFAANIELDDQDLELEILVSGQAGDVGIALDLEFGDSDDVCDLPFAYGSIELEFPFCCADVSAYVFLHCDGFRYVSFDVSGIAVPALPWLTLDAELQFSLTEKTLDLTPGFSFGEIVCFDLYFDVDTSGNLTLGDISIVGIGLSCDIGGVTFTGLSELPGGDLVDAPYWEVYTISTTDDACCGPFSFDISVYFLEGGLRLFDVGLFEAAMEIQISSQFTYNMALSIDVENQNFTEWLIGFVVAW